MHTPSGRQRRIVPDFLTAWKAGHEIFPLFAVYMVKIKEKAAFLSCDRLDRPHKMGIV